MKIIVTAILIMLNSAICYSQTECEMAASRANQDFINNNYSLHSSEILPVNNTYFYVLREYYNVNWYFTDSLDYYHCHDSIMILQLDNKFNLDFLTRAHELTDSLNNTNNWMREAEFPGGQAELYKYLIDRINSKGISRNDINGSKIFIQFDIDSTGKIQDPRIMRGMNVKLDEQVVKIFKSMPNWIPKYEYGKPVKARITYPIIIEIR